MGNWKGNRLFLVTSVLIGVIGLICLVSFFYLPYDPNKMNTANRLLLPNREYWLGTDQFGRDIFSRLIISVRYALMAGFCSVLSGAFLGILIGSTAGIYGGILQSLFMRVIDGLMAFPGTLLALMLVSVTGKGFWNAVLAIAIFMIPSFARLSFSLVLDQKNELYVKAAKSYGTGSFRLIYKHIFPSMLPRLITQFSSGIGSAILLESALSFLGLGVQPPNASLGLMLSESRNFALTYPYLAIPPGIALAVIVLLFNLLGDALNDRAIDRRTSL